MFFSLLSSFFFLLPMLMFALRFVAFRCGCTTVCFACANIHNPSISIRRNVCVYVCVCGVFLQIFHSLFFSEILLIHLIHFSIKKVIILGFRSDSSLLSQ